LRGGNPDFNNVSKQIIVDWQRGNIPFYTKPPLTEDEERLEDEKIAEMDASVKNPI
jgi:nuclear GTP-binding protein